MLRNVSTKISLLDVSYKTTFNTLMVMYIFLLCVVQLVLLLCIDQLIHYKKHNKNNIIYAEHIYNGTLI